MASAIRHLLLPPPTAECHCPETGTTICPESLVTPPRVEPATSWSQLRRATRCATMPPIRTVTVLLLKAFHSQWQFSPLCRCPRLVPNYTAWWQRHIPHMREQLAQGRYLAAKRPGIELATSRVASQCHKHHTTRPHLIRDASSNISG